MSLNRTEKQAVVTEVAALASKAQTLVLAEYRGIEVEPMTRLRAQARGKGVHLQVLKNTLARRAVAGTPFEVLAGEMTGPLIYSFSEDAIAAAKVINDFAKTNDKMVVRAGAYNGKLLNAEGVKQLASIPSREELLAKLLGVMQAPLTGFVASVAALAKKREEEATA
ncbi:50S ribosomal protein L10 [Thiomonas sp. FB-Cd]|uniref:50S ribosomal protein L10 n=1 Tax=Thiomonas sp. FB-Cd TaxID=1158292 RepID=UPI0004DF5F95|nr:50S ribosomal protein L10 [Thiomonas sp. FB-Cd]